MVKKPAAQEPGPAVTAGAAGPPWQPALRWSMSPNACDSRCGRKGVVNIPQGAGRHTTQGVPGPSASSMGLGRDRGLSGALSSFAFIFIRIRAPKARIRPTLANGRDANASVHRVSLDVHRREVSRRLCRCIGGSVEGFGVHRLGSLCLHARSSSRSCASLRSL